MKLTLLLWRREAISIGRNPFQLLLLAAIVVLGLYSIYYGHSKITEQQTTIKKAEQTEKKELHGYKELLAKGWSGEGDYREKFKYNVASKSRYAYSRQAYQVVLPPDGLSHLALGQRDVQPFYYRITGMALYYQLFQNNMANPMKLLAGNFDLSFVLVYLFPLIIIAFLYGLYAEEKENGRLHLLRLQPIGLGRILFLRMVFYYVLIVGLGILLSVFGFLVVDGNVDKHTIGPMLLWLAVLLGYMGFWFALLFFLVGLKGNSSVTALGSAGLWLLFLVVLPAALNLKAKISYPVNSSTIADITRRKSLENEEDMEEARAVIMEYLNTVDHLPGADTLIHINTLGKTYAAFSSLNDQQNKRKVARFVNQIDRRSNWVSNFRWINPAVNAQKTLNEIAGTDSGIFHDFYLSIEGFHKEIKDFYFPKVFFDLDMRMEDYGRLPSFTLKTDEKARNKRILKSIMEIFVPMLLLFGLSWWIYNRRFF